MVGTENGRNEFHTPVLMRWSAVVLQRFRPPGVNVLHQYTTDFRASSSECAPFSQTKVESVSP